MAESNSYNDKAIRKWLCDCMKNEALIGNDYFSNIRNVITWVLSDIAKGNDEHSLGDGKAFVEFSYANFKLIYKTGREMPKDVPFFIREFNYVYAKLMFYAKQNKNSKLEWVLTELRRIVYDQMDPERSWPNYFFDWLYITLLTNWDILRDWTYTYQLLWGVTFIQPWTNTIEEKTKLLELLS